MMDEEDGRVLKELGERTMSDKGFSSPTAKLADILDPTYDPNQELLLQGLVAKLNPVEMHILLMYAKLGRNTFSRHWESIAPSLED